jgi:PadR family transcriptional regulator, regulatory protein PadR
MKAAATEDWISQARRGVLEMCVLALIERRPRYGYELVTGLGRWESLATTDGTLYPLLRRLQKEGYIAGKWQESASGPPRKYYRLTPKGETLLGRVGDEWEKLAQAVFQLRKGPEPKLEKEDVHV